MPHSGVPDADGVDGRAEEGVLPRLAQERLHLRRGFRVQGLFFWGGGGGSRFQVRGLGYEAGTSAPFGVSDLRFEVWGLGCGVWSLEFGVWGSRSGVWGWGLGFGVWGLGFEVWGAGCRVQGAGCRVQGAGFM